MDEDVGAAAIAAATGRAAEIFQLRARLNRDQQKRRRAGSAHEIKERAIAGNELMPEKAALENLSGILAARSRGRNADREVADFHRQIGRRLQFDGPVQHRAVGAERLPDAERVVRGTAGKHRVAAGRRHGDVHWIGRNREPFTRAGPITHRQAEPLSRRHDLRAEGVVGIHEAGDAAVVIGETEIAFLDRAAHGFSGERRSCQQATGCENNRREKAALKPPQSKR